MTATVIRSVTILGTCLDIIRAQGRLWVAARDLAQVLRYKSESTIRQAYYRHRKHEALEGHVIKAIVGGYAGSPCRLFDEVAVMFFCQRRDRQCAIELMRWIEAGGMRLDQQPPLPGVQEIIPEEIELADAPEPPPTATSYLVPSVVDVLQQSLAKDKAYCRDLVKTMVRYCGPDEVDDLTAMIEARISSYLEAHNCPGLNAARYDLYRKYWLQGGEK
ncbi:hypothetical protein ABZQ45_27855 [Pseudomonas aeruginosa]|uniref:hypothetical protein n=1 Tax=Pseudomonas aeruginosa TaxID=287 RepID=UPI000B9FC7ED|nr:hypothetical protein [Pseudomonas aeruginosa]AVR82871.1 hypothetical protein C8257_13405 [Pseudomonas aeruginosa]AVR86612.1 hypothetical protein C8257_33410 [Pseudomonas aeruginosa]ELN3929742.1 hypothetical protein [Pseudomonas aeruginosa]OZN70968.1 hypothetical protein CGQ12_13850 [Pseudomonas aeruginosa]OZN77977.1 hypothetical protein CGQ14_13475 [Pseudomonas aeruginosa]